MYMKMYGLKITSFDDMIILTASSELSKIKMIHDKFIKKIANDLLWLSLQHLAMRNIIHQYVSYWWIHDMLELIVI